MLCNTNNCCACSLEWRENVTQCNSVTHCVFFGLPWRCIAKTNNGVSLHLHRQCLLVGSLHCWFGYFYVDLFTIRKINKIAKWDHRGGGDYKHLFLFYLIFHASGQEHSRRHFLRFLRGRFVTLELFFFFLMEITTSAQLVCFVWLCEQTH